MSGVDVAVAAKVGMPLAEKVAGPLAKSVLNHLLRRWKVRRVVARAVHFQLPAKPYSRWLKSVNVEDLSRGLAVAGPGLAADLNGFLCENDAWAAHPAQMSRALEVVKQTYFAVSAFASGADKTRLREEWAAGRHAELIDRIVALQGPTVALAPGDLADHLMLRSDARRSERMRALGVDEGVLAPFLEAAKAHLPLVPEGQPVVLVGPLGAGKSEIAELWFRDRIADLRADDGAPRPVFLRAKEMPPSFDDAVRAQTGKFAAPGTPFAIVVDGLDEVDSGTAASIERQAREFAAVATSARVLLTARPGVLVPDKTHVAYDGLSDEEAVALVEAVAGVNHATWRWDEALRDTVRRPFFAIAAGVRIAEVGRPGSQADLIEHLVTRALKTTSMETSFDVMQQMGVALTRSGGAVDGLNFQQRQLVRKSTLVTELPDRMVFSLPIFGQWFAAQEVLQNEATVDEAMASGQSFDRWRWALPVAVLAASTEQMDRILELVVRVNPGAGAWVLAQVGSSRPRQREADDHVDPGSAGRRVLLATRVWVDALGPLAPEVFPVSSASEPVCLGVSVVGNRVSLGWHRDVPEADSVTALPEDVHPWAPPHAKWLRDRFGAVAPGEEWPWLLGRDRVANSTLNILNENPLVGGVGGIWQEESRYRLLRKVLGEKSLLYPPIDRLNALEKIRTVCENHADVEHTMFVLATGQFPGPDLLDLTQWLETLGSEAVVRPVPAPDLKSSANHSIWGLYTDGRMQEYIATVLGNACEAYDEAVRHLFARFGWALGTGVPGLFGVIAELSYGPGMFGRDPGVTQMVVPLQTLHDVAESWPGTMMWSKNRRAAVALLGDDEQGVPADRFGRLMEQISADATGERPFQSFITSTSIIDVSPRPASLVAAKWLWEDLRRLDLARGTFPQLAS